MRVLQGIPLADLHTGQGTGDDQPLDLARALEDGEDRRVAVHPLLLASTAAAYPLLRTAIRPVFDWVGWALVRAHRESFPPKILPGVDLWKLRPSLLAWVQNVHEPPSP